MNFLECSYILKWQNSKHPRCYILFGEDAVCDNQFWYIKAVEGG